MVANKLWYGPLWPLLRPSPRTAITSRYTAADLGSSEYLEAVARDIILSCHKDNTGMVYLVLADASGNYDKDNDGTVIMAVPPGGSRNILQADYGSSRFDMTQIGVDSDNDYNLYYITGIMD